MNESYKWKYANWMYEIRHINGNRSIELFIYTTVSWPIGNLTEIMRKQSLSVYYYGIGAKDSFKYV